ncbi:MAG: winged helix-turn-helix transcriptional regulator [Parasporobacterium sp.]|nr:winged helix-turn-helix transcriptional regulator [Parasporobacterium sp.]
MADRTPDVNGLAKVFRMIRNSIGYFAKRYHLTVSEMAIVFEVFYQGEMSVTRLAEELGISKSTVSRLVEALVQRHYLDRVRPEENRRIVRITISDGFRSQMDMLKDDTAFKQILEADFSPEKGQLAIRKFMELVDILQESEDA